MPRPTLLVAEPEPLQALSTRKLVLETGKFNVLTAHSTREALDLYHLFPNISAAIIAVGEGLDCDTLLRTIKNAANKVPVICLSPRVGANYRDADYTLSSYEPEDLLNTMRSLFGDPRRIDEESAKEERAPSARPR